MHTIQLLIEDAGNREVITGFLDDRYEVLTTREIQQADAYLVEESLYPAVKDDLQRVVAEDNPVFRPVVLIRSANARSERSHHVGIEQGGDSPVVDALESPIRGPVLRRRLGSLLTRREQSQELHQRMEQMERQRDALNVLNQLVRHDIRNDLQLALGYAKQLTEYVGEEGEPVLETVVASTKEAIELTTDAQELTDLLLEEGSDIGSIRINEVVENEIAAVRNASPGVSVEFRPPENELTVTGDQMLSSAVRNLLTNAIRHNDAETPTVVVSLSARGDSAFLSVADNGPGIPAEDTADIFERGSMGEDSPGTGIGLYLVSAIVDRYGGDIQVDDSEFGGAEFIVELPLVENAG